MTGRKVNPQPVPQVSERLFQEGVVELARLCGWKGWHFSDSRRQVGSGALVGDADAAGWVDWVFVRGKVALFRELKSDAGRVTKDQEACLTALTGAGLDVEVWRPKDWDRIVETLSE